MSTVRALRAPVRILTGLTVAVALTSCGLVDSGPSAEEVTESYLRAVAAGDHARAAAMTNAPDQARAQLDENREGLSPESVKTTVKDVSAQESDGPVRARYDVTWDFGKGRVWRYESSMRLDDVEKGWKIRWQPSVLHPKLAQGQKLAFDENRPDPVPLVGRDGEQLMAPVKLVSINLDPARAGDVPRVAGELAGALRAVDPSIDQESILNGVKETPAGQPYVVASLREGDYQKVRQQIYELPGVSFPVRTKLLANDKGFGTQVMAGISAYVDEQLAAKAGWSVSTVDAQGARQQTLQDVPAQPAEPVATTLSSQVQRAAEKAVDPAPQPAMIVAMRPSTGELMAVAQNTPADKQGALALTGQYPPGSTFKFITASAALSAGKVNENTPLGCPAKQVFDGRTVPNDKEFELGTVPLREAFAKSCNTTFAQLGVDLPPEALPDAAKQMGLGVDFQMPGATTITGKVLPADKTTAKAANAFGQGTDLASPFGMALAVSTVVNGKMPTPSLIKGAETKADTAPEPVDPKTLGQLRSMMRQVVQSGTATLLKDSGEVAGKTGTAQFGDGTHSHGWFVGYQGDLAFAVLITDAGESKPAVAMAKEFLDGVR